MISSEMNEIMALSDRILVMRQGTISAELDPREDDCRRNSEVRHAELICEPCV